MGSVKDLEVVKKPTKTRMGVGRFHFSDRYSVFDWGEMPDHIEGKGAALCLMGAYCFERLEEKGIRTHYRGLVDEKGKVISFDELETANSSNERRTARNRQNGLEKLGLGFRKPSKAQRKSAA